MPGNQPFGLASLAEQAREIRLFPDDTVAAAVVGSTARGWATWQSDVDVYVVVDHQPDLGDRKLVPLDPQWISSTVRHTGGVRWELTYWTPGQVEQALAKVSWERFEEGTVSEGVLVPGEEIFMSRIPEAVPLVAEDWWRSARVRLGESAFLAFQVSRSLNAFDSAKQAAVGQLDRGEVECAILSARRAFDYVTDALLESHGSFGSRLTKWKPKRYASVEQSVLPWEECWSVLSMAELRDSTAEDWVERTLRLAQQVCHSIELHRTSI